MAEVHVGSVLRGNPEVGVDVLDGDRGVVEKAEEQADLEQHQEHREGHAGDRDGEAGAVVQESLESEIDHGAPQRGRIPLSRVSSRWRERALTDRQGTHLSQAITISRAQRPWTPAQSVCATSSASQDFFLRRPCSMHSCTTARSSASLSGKYW